VGAPSIIPIEGEHATAAPSHSIHAQVKKRRQVEPEVYEVPERFEDILRGRGREHKLKERRDSLLMSGGVHSFMIADHQRTGMIAHRTRSASRRAAAAAVTAAQR
jgi:hypothetical protein